MPNWVRNVVTFGDESVIKDTVVKEHGRDLFDFDKIIKMPEELDPDSDRFIDKLSLEEKMLFLKEHKADDWYHWRIANWDTKWNASETVVISKKKVIFETAWSAPLKIFKEISKKYHTKVTVRFADECITENSGKIIYEDGIEVDYIEGDKAFCRRVWGA